MKRKFLSAMLLALCIVTISVSVYAQDTNVQQAATKQAEPKDDETNLDTQLYLVVGTNQDVVDSKLPASLDGVVKQLRATLPFKNYRLAATLVNRVKNEGRLELSWIGGPLASAGSAAATSLTPTFNNFNVRLVRLMRAGDGQQIGEPPSGQDFRLHSQPGRQGAVGAQDPP